MQFSSWLKKIVRTSLPESAVFYFKSIYCPLKFRKLDLSVEPELSVIEKFLQKDDCVVDVGANIGLYTKFMSEFVGEGGRVLSLEPIPQTFKLLKSNVEKLHLNNVQCFQYAASDKSDTLSMSVPDYSDGGKNYYMAKVVEAEESLMPGAATEVNAVRLDSLLESFEADIIFVKCDVEGHELSCLKGAHRILSNTQPIWMIEVSGNPDEKVSDAHQLLDMMSQFGYKTFILDGNALRPRRNGDIAVNYWFFGDKHIANFDLWGLVQLPQ